MNVEELLAEAIRQDTAGSRSDAVDTLGRVLTLDPKCYDALHHLGSILAAEGHHGHAIACFNRALSVRPNSADTLVKLGESYIRSQRGEEAAAFFRRALDLNPNQAEAYRDLGLIAEVQNRLDEAAAYRERYLAMRPDSAEAMHDLGRVMGRRGQHERAAELLRRGFAIEPNRLTLAYELGVAEMSLDRNEEAIACFRQATAVDPSDVKAHANLGRCLMKLGRREEALEAFLRAAALAPGDVRYHNSVGAAMMHLGRRDEAIARFDECIRLNPDYPDAHANRAHALLLAGDFERGWQEYEWRWRIGPLKNANFGRPLWDGSNLAGRSILVACEQGFGDAIQFIRYAALLKEQGAVTAVSCHPELMSLFSKCPTIDHVLDNRQPLPMTNVFAPLLSLPAIYRTTLETIPGGVPYLFTSGPRVVHWKQKLVALEGLKVGIAWKGSSEHAGDMERSVGIEWIASLAPVPGVSFVSLQKDGNLGSPPPFPVTDLSDQLDSFAETAAIMKNLDLVIAVDTAVAHLAGALGIPVWVALPFAPDWRWLLDREDSPWYPSMWLVRQPERGDWHSVFERIFYALAELAQKARSDEE